MGKDEALLLLKAIEAIEELIEEEDREGAIHFTTELKNIISTKLMVHQMEGFLDFVSNKGFEEEEEEGSYALIEVATEEDYSYLMELIRKDKMEG